MRSETLLAAWLALWAFVVVVVLARVVVRRRLLRLRYGGAAMSTDLAGAIRKAAPFVLLFGASTCLVLLFAQVRLDRSQGTATVVLAIDVSDSMLATDVRPDRLTAAKAAATSFLGEVPDGFRVGVVTFAGAANTVAEPGEDRAVVADTIGGLTPSRGTVIGDGLAEALALVASERTADPDLPAAGVLISDGADTGSVVAPGEAAARAREMAVPVFTVAIVGDTEDDTGKEGGDTELLRSIAATTGGALSTAASAGELGQVYDRLGARLTSDLAVGSSATPLLVAAAALTALSVALFLGVGRRR
ncbi:MAG TPA: VWA domain-containing protein [Actinomycetota bacterium]|nr:VWA domain-containing protein [Actinomycetota bacterium]